MRDVSPAQVLGQAVRLYPPGSEGWFIELLTVPGSEHGLEREWTRIVLSTGHYGLASFGFMSLAVYLPVKTTLGIYCARPEMMALANLLEHPKVGKEVMSGLIAGRRIKRTNKDLGRVMAIARLSAGDNVQLWPAAWQEALEVCFPRAGRTLAQRTGDGLRELLRSEPDLDQALLTCNNGLLAQLPLNLEQLRATAERLMQDAIEPIEAWSRA